MCVVVVHESSLFHESGWVVLGGERVEWMFWVLCFLSELGCVKFQVIVYGEDLGFFV